MSLTTVQLWQSMQESKIATASECRSWASELLETSGNQVLDNPQLMLAQLVKRGRLTPFQANALLSNSLQTLTIGRHKLLAPLTAPPLMDWFEAIDPSSDALRWLYAISSERLKREDLDRNPPSLLFARAHANIRGEGLQSFSPPAYIDDYLIIAASPAQGRPLRDRIKELPNRILPANEAFQIVLGVAGALSKLHAQNIVHGRIGIDQVWWNDETEVTLLRDPFFYPSSPLGQATPVSVGVKDDIDFRIRYAAPEFSVPNQQPTQATDIYALGCLWWELLTGQMPYSELMLDKVPTAAAKFPLTMPSVPDFSVGQHKCMAHMLSKNPLSRFANAELLFVALNAIDFVAPAIKKPTSPITSPAIVAPKSTDREMEQPEQNPKLQDSELDAPSVIVKNENESSVSSVVQKSSVNESQPTTLDSSKPKPQKPNVAIPIPTKVPLPSEPSKADPSPLTKSGQKSPPPKSSVEAPKPTTVALSDVKSEKVKSVPPSPTKFSLSTEVPAVVNPSTLTPAQQATPKLRPSSQSPAETERATSDSLPALKTAEPTNRDSLAKKQPSIPDNNIDQTSPTPAKPTNFPPPSNPTHPQADFVEISKPEQVPKLNLALPPNGPALSTAKPKSKKSKKNSQRPVWLLPSMLGACLVFLAGLVWLLSPPSPAPTVVSNSPTPPTQTQTPAPDQSNALASQTSVASEAPNQKVRSIDPFSEQFVLTEKDDSIPWLPPHPSQPYSLELLPPGAQGFLFVKPQAWLSTDQGKAIAEVAASEIEAIWQTVAKLGGWNIDEIDELAIALYGGRSDGWPRLVHRVKLRQAISIADFKKRLGNPSPQSTAENQKYYLVQDRAVYSSVQSENDEETFDSWTTGPIELIKELAELNGKAGPLRRQMEQLWQASDAKSDFTAILSTPPFFADARSVLPSVSARLQELCKTWFDEKAQAILITSTQTPDWYAEVRIIGNTNDDALRFVNELRDKMKPLANTVEAEINAAPPTPFWRSLATRFPQMLRTLNKYQRFGIENGQAVTNFYLPKSATANLLIASWMSLQSPISSPTVVGTTSSNQPATTSAIKGEGALDFLVDIGFDQEPLDFALAAITEELNKALPSGSTPVKIAIDGKAFELAGVTRNQQVREFRFKQQPLRLLLNDIAKRLNPDRTVTSITEDKQVVLWIVDATDSQVDLTFTTRPAAKAANHPIPKEFSAP